MPPIDVISFVILNHIWCGPGGDLCPVSGGDNVSVVSTDNSSGKESVDSGVSKDGELRRLRDLLMIY